MIVDYTFIGEYTEDDFRSFGVVFEAETEEDHELLKSMLDNPKKTMMYLKQHFRPQKNKKK